MLSSSRFPRMSDKLYKEETEMSLEHVSKTVVFRRILFMFGLALIAATLIGVSSVAADDKTQTGEAKFATLDGAKVHYVNYGNGSDALVLIHGWTQNIDSWRDQIPELSKRSRVIAIDLPGHGKSDKPEIKYSMDLFARAVDAVLQDAKVNRAVLAGHSMGTPVARQFYRKYPDKTLALVIVDGALRPFGNKEMMDQLIAGLRGPKYKETIDGMFGMMLGSGMPAETQQRIKSATASTPQHVLVSAMEGMADPAIWGDDKINVPTLSILAKNPFYPPNIDELNRGVAPNIEQTMWEGVGHWLMMDKPKEFNAAVIAFLDKHKLLKK